MPKIIEYMLCLIENGIIFVFFNSLIETRSKNKFFILPIIFINATVIFLCTDMFIPLRAIILTAITIIGSCILFKGALHIKAALSFTVLFIFNIIDIMFGLLLSLVLSEHVYAIFFESTIRRVILCLIIKVVDILVIYTVYKMFSKFRLEINRKIWILFCLIISTFLFVTVIFTELYQEAPKNLSVSMLYFIASLAFFITGMISLYFFAYICSSFAKEKRMYILQNGYDGVKEQLAIQSDNAKRLSKIRHDTKNHLQNAKALLSQGKYDSVESLISEMIEQTNNIHLELNAVTENEIIDAAIAVKYAICKSQGIDFKLTCEPLPKLNISEIDLSSLISNILDNAITAAKKTDKPRVKISVLTRGDYLNIVSENTYIGEIKKSDEGKLTTFTSTKFNSSKHGFGTQIIGEIASKYDGTCVYEFENGVFKMNVMLNYTTTLSKSI